MELNNEQRMYINKKLENLSHSKFRSSFHLRKYMKEYIKKNGWEKMESHCHDFIDKKL